LGIGLVSSLLLVRYLGTELYGGYAYFTAVAAIPPIFYGALANSISRFVPSVETKEERVRILLGAVLWQLQLFSTLVLLSCVIFWLVPEIRFWERHLTVGSFSFKWVLVLMLLALPVTLVNQWLSGYAAAIQKIGYCLALNSAFELLRLGLLVTIYIEVESRLEGLELLLVGQLLLRLVVILMWVIKHTHWGQLWHPLFAIPFSEWRPVLQSTFQHHIRSYTGPTQLQSIVALIKNYLPVLILGQQILYT